MFFLWGLIFFCIFVMWLRGIFFVENLIINALKHENDMKTSAISVKRVLVVMLFLAASIYAQCQNNWISMASGCQYCDTSIVRKWNAEWSLLFTNSGCGNQFHIIDVSGTNLVSFLTKCDVKDMEIIEDTAYFCGMDGNGNPVIGYFVITDMLSGTLQENRILLPVSTGYAITPRRLEAFHVSDGVHIVMVEDKKFPSGIVKRVLADVFKAYSAGGWFIEELFYSNYDADDDYFYCDDIAVTDNYVFASGHKRYSSGIYMRHFEKPTSALVVPGMFYSISQSTLGNIIYDYFNNLVPNPYFNVVGDTYGEHYVYCTHTTGDNVVIACMSINGGSVADTFGVTVKNIYVPSMGLTNDVFLSYSSASLSSDWDVRDVRYDADNDAVLVLHDRNIPGTGVAGSVVTVVDYPAFSNRFSLYPISGFYQHSMDRFPYIGTAMISCGNSYSGTQNLTIGMNEWGASLCYGKFVMPIMRSYKCLQSFRVPLNSSSFQVFSPVEVDEQVGLDVDIMCEDE